MPVGGKRPGAGRPKGAKNKTSIAKEAAKGGELPLEYMLRVMRDKNADISRRDSMAEKAAPFLHAKLASVTHTGANGGPILTRDVSKLTDEQLDAIEKILTAPGSAQQGGTAGADQGGESKTRH